MNVESTLRTTTVTGLVNGESYTFSLQPVYSDRKKGGRLSVNVTPTSTRPPVTNLIVAAGDQKVRLKWTRPESDDLQEYRLLISSISDPVLIPREEESWEVTGLTNNTEYEFSLICVYPNGTSDAVRAKATPGQVYPIIVATNTLSLNEPCTFTYNDMYFTMGTIQAARWDFGDGNTSTESEPVHSFAQTGTYTVTVTITYEDETSESGSIEMEVSGYKWSVMELNHNGLSGYVKVSNPVFSPDGKTAYIPTSTPDGHLFAVDVVSGTVKWAFEIPDVTYGGGAVVDENGIIYQCGTDSKVYAIHPEDGSPKWSCEVDAVIGAFPALSSTGVLYCLTNKVTLFAIDTTTGTTLWQKTLSGGTGGAVAIDASGHIYAGTDAAIHKFAPSGDEVWKTSQTIQVTERGAFAIDAAGTTLYATQRGSNGLSAIDMATGNVNWTYANTGGGDAYFPVAAPDGTIYFNDKGGRKVYAIRSNGILAWEKELGAALTYCGLVLADNGTIYCATQGKVGDYYSIYGLNTTTGEVAFKYDSEEQFMAAATIGPDKRLYIGTIGSNNVGSLLALPVEAGPETSSWSVRGGNLYGTNRK
ncbi:MAG: PQQ-binding-like beta-propeller repeat protein [Bacteroides sp.]|nr:PQQ-binding-like beta-propeller repeat protein [Bacteroides sp.]